MQSSWYLIGNPNSGKGKVSSFITEIQKYFEAHSLTLQICEDFEKQSFLRTTEAIRKGYRKLLVCGGDGTINQVVNAVFQQNEVDPNDILVSFLPFGTGNDWIKTVGIPVDSQKALELISHGNEKKLDVGELWCSWGKERKKAYFINIAGIGYDAFVIEEMQKRTDLDSLGKLSYLTAAVGYLMKYKRTQMKITSEEFSYEGPVLSGCIGKGKYNGNGMMQTPHADPENGKLAVMLMTDISKLKLLTLTSNVYNGTFIKSKGIKTFETEKLHVESYPPVRVECEGELLGFSPFDFTIRPKAFRILVP